MNLNHFTKEYEKQIYFQIDQNSSFFQDSTKIFQILYFNSIENHPIISELFFRHKNDINF